MYEIEIRVYIWIEFANRDCHRGVKIHWIRNVLLL